MHDKSIQRRVMRGALTLGVLMAAVIAENKAQAQTQEERLKDLQTTVAIIQQQLAISTLQQTEQAKLAQSVADALKGQVTSESDLARLQAQSEFAKLAGIKAGLESVGPPPGKEGKLTITTGTAGALLLNLKKPMLEGLNTAAEHVAAMAKDNAEVLSGGVVLATDAQIQAALQSQVTAASLSDTGKQIEAAVTDIKGRGFTTASAAAAIAGAGLALKTLTDLSKFFRADRSMTVFDAGEEPNQLLRLLLERQLAAQDISFLTLDDINPTSIVKLAQTAQEALANLAVKHEEAAALMVQIEKLAPADPKRPSADKVDKLKASMTLAKELLDDLHPVRKPEAFWAYISGQYKYGRMQGRSRITLNAKSQTIQVIESRVFRSDKIYGSADAQVDYRIVDKDGALVTSGVWLWTSKDPTHPLVLPGLRNAKVKPAPTLEVPRKPETDLTPSLPPST